MDLLKNVHSDSIDEKILNAPGVILEAWRRGLDIYIYLNDVGELNFTLSDGTNTQPFSTNNLLSPQGNDWNTPSQLIDFYFPDYKDHSMEEGKKLYIDFHSLYETLINQTAVGIELASFPESPVLLKRYLLTNINYSQDLAEQVRQLAYSCNINGYIKALKSGDTAIVVGGNEATIANFSTKMKEVVMDQYPGATIKAKSRQTPIAQGFHIVDYKSMKAPANKTNEHLLNKFSELKNDYQELVKKLADYESKESIRELTAKQNKHLKKQLKSMEESSSWVLTKPLRKLAGSIKRKS
ncbi:hypothetical protein [Thalassobacillus hwangdonensis]|uniref:Uncharacterized protein n=1 Tax=Thalassobacillus hwangdonensis TaxID=546108 RepID=A0ABW3L267_9BACI